MTTRNRHDRTSDHDVDSTLDLSDVDVDAFGSYAARTTLSFVLADIMGQLPTKHAVVAQALVRRTMMWPELNNVILAEAVIGTPSGLHRPDFMTAAASIRRGGTGSKTANAVIKRNQTGSLGADAKIV